MKCFMKRVMQSMGEERVEELISLCNELAAASKYMQRFSNVTMRISSGDAWAIQ